MHTHSLDALVRAVEVQLRRRVPASGDAHTRAVQIDRIVERLSSQVDLREVRAELVERVSARVEARHS